MATVAECLKGKCSCDSASECEFKRCDNCDYPVDAATGKTLVDHRCKEYETCPHCDGPLNDQRIYGALVD